MNDRVLKITRISMLLSLAVIIHSAEAFIPVNVLWFRFGFANIITVAVLFLYGFRTAFLITVIRIFLGSILIGALGSPAFILSLSGGLAAIAAMGLCKREQPAVAKIKLDAELYERCKKIADIAGYSSPEEFITHVIEKELARIDSDDATDEDVTERLRGLGYID